MNNTSMTRREMFRVLHEPQGGWADDVELDRAYAEFEAGQRFDARVAELPASEFDAALVAWLARAQAICDKRGGLALEIDPRGRVYVRIWQTMRGVTGRSAYAFIERATGNVLKPGTWKAPEPKKIPRGNIYKTGEEGVTEYGAKYVR